MSQKFTKDLSGLDRTEARSVKVYTSGVDSISADTEIVAQAITELQKATPAISNTTPPVAELVDIAEELLAIHDAQANDYGNALQLVTSSQLNSYNKGDAYNNNINNSQSNCSEYSSVVYTSPNTYNVRYQNNVASGGNVSSTAANFVENLASNQTVSAQSQFGQGQDTVQIVVTENEVLANALMDTSGIITLREENLTPEVLTDISTDLTQNATSQQTRSAHQQSGSAQSEANTTKQSQSFEVNISQSLSNIRRVSSYGPTCASSPAAISSESFDSLPQGSESEIIVYVEEGFMPGSMGELESKNLQLVDTAVQANDYEIERRSGRVPARKRIIPHKFRDYRHPDHAENTDSDEDYVPEVRVPRKRKTDSSAAVEEGILPKRVGRPRKHAFPSEMNQNSEEQTASESHGPNPEQNTGDGAHKGFKDEIGDIVMPVNKRGRGRPRHTDIDDTDGLKCQFCSRVFSQKGNLKVHLRIHNDERPFLCQESECNKAFRSNESLRRHKLSQHMGVKPFECEICHNKFSSNVSLQEHFSRHTDSKPYKCNHCNRHFRQISCLRRHLITHTHEQPYPCKICGRQFSQLVYLRSHMKTHTGEKPFSCDICGKKFAHQSDVGRHKIIHTGKKPYACSICSVTFSDPSSRRRHEREHASKKSYACQICHDTFKRAGQLKAHLNRKHSQGISLKFDKDGSAGPLVFTYKDEEERAVSSVSDEQPRIVKLIKNLQDKKFLTHFVEISLPPSSKEGSDDNYNSGQKVLEPAQTIIMTPDSHLTETVQLEKMGEESSLEVTEGSVPIELQGVEIQNGGEEGQTYITITNVADLVESIGEKNNSDGSVEYSYQIIQEIPSAECQEEVVLHVNTDEDHISQGQNESDQEHTKDLNSKVTEELKTASSDSISAHQTTSVDYVSNPDFTSQDYYNWLSSFTELCKVVPMPLDVSLFQKISQVHKTLSDVMATPSGVIADIDNFRVLMNISKDLSSIINEHLLYVMQNLNDSESKEST
ncbi:hypothetical protein CHS0354_006486 [Potamilus streckersoni]|uniref:C2H2-type domain-containing protein n=1 Tax=Potamilus streckersoni TaxID=2493646 RepID=A0AAE0W8L3_9BIVA|nr:hypothetical protein CHS0354_006486 [Potamilus streckersoni]